MPNIYQPTDVVLAKVKGFPAWPAMVIPKELIPENVWKIRSRISVDKAETKEDQDSTPDEEFGSDYDPNDYIIYSKVLKFKKNKEQPSLYCVKFMCDDSYIWVKQSDMQPLSVEECQEWLASKTKKNKKLIPAYEMAMKGSSGIDVWEFVEYGSMGKPDEDEYIEDDFEEPATTRRSRSKNAKIKPMRSSSRQRKKLESSVDEDDIGEAGRRTRTRAKQTNSKRDQLHALEDIIETPNKRTRKEQISKKVQTKKTKAIKPKIPEKEYYRYEDDDDWSIVGLGPQETEIGKCLSAVVKKSISKKSGDRHSEMKLDLEDKILSINKLLEVSLYKMIKNDQNQDDSLKNDLELIADEIAVALNIKGSMTEFLTVFNSNNQLIMNYRLLMNLGKKDLEKWNLWDDFQSFFQTIYDCAFIPDSHQWEVPLEEDTNNEVQPPNEVKESIQEEILAE